MTTQEVNKFEDSQAAFQYNTVPGGEDQPPPPYPGLPSQNPPYPIPPGQGPAPGYPPATGYAPQPSGLAPSGYPPINNVAPYQTGPLTTQPQSVVVVTQGNCPSCRVGYLTDAYTPCGVCLAIFCFPCGILCCISMRQKQCTHCGFRP